MKYTVLLGRILFSLIFVIGGISNFSKQAIEHAATQGIPLAAIAVPLSGVIALMGGLSIALGYKAKWGAWLLILFLAPATVMMHNFWAVQDSTLAQMHQVMFMKNLSMLGAALLISYFGAGPLSVDGRQKTHSEQRIQRLQYRKAVIGWRIGQSSPEIERRRKNLANVD